VICCARSALASAVAGEPESGSGARAGPVRVAAWDESRKGRGRGSPPLFRQARPVASTASSTYRRALSCSAATTQQRCDLRTGVSRLIPWQEPDRHRALTDALTRDPDRVPGGRRRSTIRRSRAAFTRRRGRSAARITISNSDTTGDSTGLNTGRLVVCPGGN